MQWHKQTKSHFGRANTTLRPHQSATPWRLWSQRHRRGCPRWPHFQPGPSIATSPTPHWQYPSQSWSWQFRRRQRHHPLGRCPIRRDGHRFAISSAGTKEQNEPAARAASSEQHQKRPQRHGRNRSSVGDIRAQDKRSYKGSTRISNHAHRTCNDSRLMREPFDRGTNHVTRNDEEERAVTRGGFAVLGTMGSNRMAVEGPHGSPHPMSFIARTRTW